MKMRKFKKGFTLVELVVVIAVIAVLAAVSVGAYFGVTDSANSSDATQGKKQITDLWYVYSLDREFDPNASIKEKADDFCLEFLPDMGPNYDVNWKEVDLYKEPVEKTETTNLNKIPHIQKANSNSVETTSGILFKIETKYPTWFIVLDDRIVEESETIYKSEDDFMTSLASSSYLVNAPVKGEDGYNYPFSIEIIGKDSQGKNVRGYSYYKVEIYNKESNDLKEILSVKVGDSIKETAPDKYDTSSTTTVEGSNRTYQSITITEKETNIEIDTTEKLALNKKTIFEKSDRVELENEKYAYYVNESPYALNYMENSSSESLDDYPIIFVEYSINETADPSSDSLVNTIIEYDVSSDYKEGSGWLSKTISGHTKKIITETYVYDINELQTKYYLYTDISQEFFNEKNEQTSSYYIFAKNYVIDQSITIPSNVTMVIDYKVETIEDAKTYISFMSGNKTYNLIKECESLESYSAKVSKGLDSSIIKSWKELFLEAIQPQTKQYGNPNIIGGPTPNDSSFEAKFNSFVNNDYRPIKVDSNFETSENNIKNVLTIKNNSKLTIQKNSYLIIESEIYTADSKKPIRNGDHAVVNIEEGSSLRLENSGLKAIGKINGEGNVYADESSKVLEILKINDFIGGTYTTALVGGGLKLSNITYFPFMDYSFENITAKLHLSTQSLWYAISSVTVSNAIVDIPPAYIYSAVSNSTKSLFQVVNPLENDYPFTKQYNLETKRSEIALNGEFTEGSISITLNLFNQEATISTENTQLPFSNIDVTINKNSIFTLDAKRGYDFMPSSRLNVMGTVNIDNQSQLRIITPDVFKQIMLKDHSQQGDKAEAQHYTTGKYENYSKIEFKEEEKMINVLEGGVINGNLFTYPKDLVINGDERNYTLPEFNYYGFNASLDFSKTAKFDFALRYKPGNGSGIIDALDKLSAANFDSITLYKLVLDQIIG